MKKTGNQSIQLQEFSPFKSFYNVKNQLEKHVYERAERAFDLGNSERDKIKTIDELEAYNENMRKRFIHSLGGLPSGDTPLNSRITGVLKFSGYKIEKVIFESLPEVYVTANLYIPDSATSPTGTVIFACGHSEDAKYSDEYQTVCQYLVKTGLVVFAFDPIGQGERMSYYERISGDTTIRWGTSEHSYAGLQSWPLGDSIARYFLNDIKRSVDYLCTRSEVDDTRIGITGNSGGGTQTCLMMLTDKRIAAAAPATFVMNRRTYMYTGIVQDSEQIWPGMTANGYDHENILMAMAPRPVLVLSVTSDFFPIEGARETVASTRRFWDMYEKGDCIEHFIDDSTHYFTVPMAKATAEFFSRHLLGRDVKTDEMNVKPVDHKCLMSTSSGQVRGEMKDSKAVFEYNCLRTDEFEQKRKSAEDDELKKEGRKWLSERVFKDRDVCDVNIRRFNEMPLYEHTAECCVWWSQKNIMNYSTVIRNIKFKDKALPVTIALWEDGTADIRSHMDWIRKTCTGGRAVMVLDVTGSGNILPNDFNANHPCDLNGSIANLTNELVWLDDSLAAIRVFDVIRSMDMLDEMKGIESSDIELYCHGWSGVYGRLAAFLDTRPKNVVIDDSPESMAVWVKSRYYDEYDMPGFILPGMLRYFDLPDTDRWLGQRLSRIK